MILCRKKEIRFSHSWIVFIIINPYVEQPGYFLWISRWSVLLQNLDDFGKQKKNKVTNESQTRTKKKVICIEMNRRCASRETVQFPNDLINQKNRYKSANFLGCLYGYPIEAKYGSR